VRRRSRRGRGRRHSAYADRACLEQLAPLETKLRQRRKSLTDEVGRAAESIALNVSEARLWRLTH
jgi:hypothetical protein